MACTFGSPNKADIIRAKHQHLAYVLRTNDTEEELDQQLHSSVRTNNLETSLRLLVQGADPNYYHEVSYTNHYKFRQLSSDESAHLSFCPIKNSS